MSDDKNKRPPGPRRDEKVDVHDIYRFVSTKLNEALLEIESLVILGQLLYNDVDHFVDSEVVDEVESALVKIDKNRLQHQHGVSSSVDNVFFLEQHPYFFPKDEEDEQET